VQSSTLSLVFPYHKADHVKINKIRTVIGEGPIKLAQYIRRKTTKITPIRTPAPDCLEIPLWTYHDQRAKTLSVFQRYNGWPIIAGISHQHNSSPDKLEKLKILWGASGDKNRKRLGMRPFPHIQIIPKQF